MEERKLSANISMLFTELDSFVERYQAASLAGFKAVESAFPPPEYSKEELAEARERNGVEHVLLNVEAGCNFGYAAMEGEEQLFMDSLLKTIDYCIALKCPRIHIMCGRGIYGHVGSESTLRSNLAKALPLLEEHGLTGLIEPINCRTVPGYFLHDYDLAERIIKDFNSPHLRLQLDIFHLQIIKGDLTNNILDYLPFTGHIQIAQAPYRNEPGSPGEILYQYVFLILEENGYEDWIGLEYTPEYKTLPGLNWISDLLDHEYLG